MKYCFIFINQIFIRKQNAYIKFIGIFLWIYDIVGTGGVGEGKIDLLYLEQEKFCSFLMGDFGNEAESYF